MDIRIESRGDLKIVAPNAALLDGAEIELLEAATPLLAERGCRVVLDLRDVESLNSSGLGVLVQLGARANLQGGTLALARPTAYVSGVLEMTQLTKFFRVFGELDDAVRALQAA